MKRSRLTAALAACTVLVAAAAPTFAASLAGDFSVTNGNPNGDWTYGFTPSLTPGYTLLPYASSTTGTLTSWTANLLGTGTPLVAHNTSASAYAGGSVIIPAGAATLHPGPSGELSIARYTVPATGLYNVAATFTGYDHHHFNQPGGPGTTTDVHVLLNGVSLFSDMVLTYLDTASLSLPAIPLTAGDTLDFAVGIGGNDYTFDTTGLAATIDRVRDAGTPVVPTPAAAGAGLTLLTGLLAARRRA